MSLFNKVAIIAECGINHNGSLKRAKEMVDIAIDSGADFVKFQIFNTEALVRKEAPLAAYQKKSVNNSDSQFELLKRYELTEQDFKELYDYCVKKKISFLATPFDIGSLQFLNSLGVEYIKVSSGDLTNGPLLLEMARLNKNIILSTGMANLDDIFNALAILQYGYDNRDSKNPQLFDDIAWLSEQKNFSKLRDNVTILHCTSSYPAEPKSLNLRAIQTLQDKTNLTIGYSDHSVGIHIPVAAVSLGARIIEKHFTLSKNLPGPDHQASIEPSELKQMVSNIKDIELALGSGEKKIDASEIETSRIVRKGLYAKRKILKGELLQEGSIDILRPEAKSSPMLLWDKLGAVAEKDYEIGDPL
ncbi:MAG TPA: N-acetylneuraminate synthase [Gammaproteobacteria bacterium]|nr:N-acetylneuraminate synthase [Gammaproteobacteria bacterium]